MTSLSVLEGVTICVKRNGSDTSGLEHKQPSFTSIHQPWITSNSLHVNCPGSPFHESAPFMTPTNLASTPMDNDHLIAMSSQVKGSGESTSLFPNEPEPRPYQAYCVTEASSRPPSPDILRPQPLHIRSSVVRERNTATRSSTSEPIVQASATNIEESSILAIPPGEANESNEPLVPSNQELSLGSTMLANRHHITQAVTPRGSHPLKTDQTRMYDATPSHLRMQPITPKDVATSTAFRRKLLPRNNSDVGMDHHPLPPLPNETAAILDLHGYKVESQTLDGGSSKRTRQQLKLRVQSGNASPITERYSFNDHGAEERAMPMRTAASRGEITSLTESSAIPPIDVYAPGLQAPGIDVSAPEFDERLRQSDARQWQPQLKSSEELYIPRGLLAELEDDRRAHRRTQPKDAKLKYQFGRRPSVRLDNMPPPPPLHAPWPKPSQTVLQSDTKERPRSNDYFQQPPLSPYLDAKLSPGPRPPPWGSHDNLKLQRITRSGAREREDARKYRLTADSGSSTYKGSESTESLRENTMRREVEEYREQVLRLYPDLEFDVNTGKVGRSCCWCVVM